MVKRNLASMTSIGLKKTLYLSLVRSHLVYGAQLWHPYLIKDIRKLEKVQRRATRYILQDNRLDYKTRLIKLDILPLAMWLEMQDVLFLVKCLKDPPDNFNICILQYQSIFKG